jgi:DHA1 family bicyclomycin/chloramphenicol resistance-like MFS transporter
VRKNVIIEENHSDWVIKKRPSDLVLILILGMLSTLSPFSIDMYLPAFSQMAESLQTSVGQISLSVSSYFVGFALGQIFYGPLLDRFGRKPPLYFGLFLYAAATIGCLFASDVNMLIAVRFVQALGGCAALVASTTMVRDFFGADKAGRVFSIVVLIIGVSPLLAPTLGGFMTSAFGWHSVFYFLLGMVAVTALAVFFVLPESHGPNPSLSLKPKPILSGFFTVLKEPQFFTYAFAGAFSFSSLFVYVAGSPIIFMEFFKLSAEAYGMVFAILSVGFIGGSQLNLLLLRRFKEEQIFGAAVVGQCLVAIVAVVATLAGITNLWMTVGLFFCVLSCLGLINPNASALALAPFSRNAGSASALLGFLQIGMGAIASVGVGAFNDGTAKPTFVILAVTSILALTVFRLGRKRIKNLAENEGNVSVAIH